MAESATQGDKRRILKWTIHGPEITLPLADTDEILSAGLQDDEIVVWAVRDERKYRKRGRRIVCLNTGTEIHDSIVIRQHIATLTTTNGIVWHVLEVAGA